MLFASFALVGQLLQPVPQEYAVDTGHSILEFSIRFLVTRVKGRFTQWHGTILYDSLRPEHSSITVVVETKSIDTGWPHRDQHLRTSDFFAVERYPTILFQSDRLRQVAAGWVAEGQLTMHGVTRTVALPFRFLPGSPQRAPESRSMTLNLEGNLRLARADFGITGGSTYHSWFNQARAATMGDSVDLSFEVEAWRADAASLRPPQVDSAIARVATGGADPYLKALEERRQRAPANQWASYYRGPEFVARGLLWEGRTQDAVALAAGLTRLFPELPDAQLLLGFAAQVAKDSRGSAEAYAKGRELFAKTPRPKPDPEFPQVDDHWYYLDQLIRTALERGTTQAALGLARVVAELYPDIARAQARLGQALAAAGQAAEAQAAFAKALAADPNDTMALEYRRRTARRPAEGAP